MSMITELVERLRKAADFRHTIGDYMTAGLHREAANTIEAYQKAFEDIRAELYKERINISFNNLSEEKARWTNSGIYDGLVWAEEIIDKHNPDKVGKEGSDADSD